MFGCIPSTTAQVADDMAQRPLACLVGSVPRRRTLLDLSPHLDAVPDQGATSTCVQNAGSSAMVVANGAQGHPIPRPSRRWLHAVTHWSGAPGTTIADDGSNAVLMCQGAAKHGLVSEARLPFDIGLINEPPPFDADIAGQDALFLDWWRASADPEELALALDRHEVPILAIPVHSNFVDWSTDAPYDGTDGDFRGYHMLTVVGFEENPVPGLVFLVLNSWGPTWGQGGFIRMTGRCLRRIAFDRLVIRSAPAPR